MVMTICSELKKLDPSKFFVPESWATAVLKEVATQIYSLYT